ncbi:hypothetical protein [Victivallis vadensis]|uniref:hypothetical protein n=1 Tax=Victivallis vadensis TaxID=172901 RepID=UPI00307E10FB
MAEEVSELTFGVEKVPALGILQNKNINNSAEIAEARGEDGKVIEQRAYSVSGERQYESLMVKATNPQPKIGTILTDGEWTGLITSLNETQSNTEYRKYSVTAQKKDAAALIPYAETASE